MARPKPEKKSKPTAPDGRGVLPMELQVGDRLVDETGEWEVIAPPYSTAGGRVIHARVYLLAWTGLRISEACGLQWGDLDFGGHFLSVNRAVVYRQHRLIVGAPKSGKSRRVDLPEALVARLRARQSVSEAEATVAGHEPSSWVFPAPSDDTKPMNAAFLRFKIWYRLLRRAEVRAIRIHDLRHTYASLLLLAGEPMLYVKEQLGHSTVQVTVDFYGHIRPGLNRGAVNRLAEATRPGAPAVELHSDYTSERR